MTSRTNAATAHGSDPDSARIRSVAPGIAGVSDGSHGRRRAAPRTDIQGLRAIAVSLVVVYLRARHGAVPGAWPGGDTPVTAADPGRPS